MRQLLCEPFSSHRIVRRSAKAIRASRRASCRARLKPNHPLKRRERAVGQYAGPVSINPYAEAPRASCRGVRRARLDRTTSRSAASEPSGSTLGPSRPNHPPKRYERATGQAARPVSNLTIHRSLTSEPPGKPPGPSRSIRRSDVRKLSGTPPGIRQPTAVVTRCASTPPSARASGRFHYRTEPLRLFAVNPLTVGDFRRMAMWGFILV